MSSTKIPKPQQVPQIFTLEDCKLISDENKYNPQEPRLFFNISKEQYTTLPECKCKSISKDKTMYGLNCKPVDKKEDKWTKFDTYDIKIGFETTKSRGGKEYCICYVKQLKDKGKVNVEASDKLKRLLG